MCHFFRAHLVEIVARIRYLVIKEVSEPYLISN